MTVDADVPRSLSISQFTFPLAMIQQAKPFDPKAVDIDVNLTGGPIIITTPDGIKTALADLHQLIDVELAGLEEKAEKAGAPWTPGRVPTWTKE